MQRLGQMIRCVMGCVRWIKVLRRLITHAVAFGRMGLMASHYLSPQPLRHITVSDKVKPTKRHDGDVK